MKVLKRLKSRRGLPTRSYIDVELLTGRKHQIRVHLASERHPLVGDELYGTPRPCGLMLHAHSVSFAHPVTGEHIHIEAPCPWEPKPPQWGQAPLWWFCRNGSATVQKRLDL